MPTSNRFLGLLILPLLFVSNTEAARLKELATLEGVRDNQLIGYGLVVGLNGSGDRRQTVFSTQSLTNILQQMGVAVSPNAIRVNNIAAVMVTATLPPFAQPGGRIDVNVAAIGDATTLQGGLLLMTTLKSIDGQPFAVAQGPVVTGGFVAGRAQSSQTVNHPTVGKIPNGAIVEIAAPSQLASNAIRLQLRNADFTTASHVVAAINQRFADQAPEPVATAANSGLVQVTIPESYGTRMVDFLADLERLEVDADRVAKVVVNERTGTIIMGKDVKVSPIAIMHGNLSVEVQTDLNVSQPNAFSQGQTQVTPQASVAIREEQTRNVVLQEGASVEQLVRSLQGVGTTPRDVIAILQALRAAGALEAVLEVI
jgi:flagellar P-ring protein precursor FlgI